MKKYKVVKKSELDKVFDDPTQIKDALQKLEEKQELTAPKIIDQTSNDELDINDENDMRNYLEYRTFLEKFIDFAGTHPDVVVFKGRKSRGGTAIRISEMRVENDGTKEVEE